MTTMKEAFQIAKNTILDILGDEIIDIRLEEVDLSSSKDYWELIISFLSPQKNPTTIPALSSFYDRRYERLYKKIIVMKENGEVISLKIFKNE